MVRSTIAVVALSLMGWILGGCSQAVDGSAPLESATVLAAPSPIDVAIDPAFDIPARAALAEWSKASGLQFNVTTVPTEAQSHDHGLRFAVGSEAPNLARTYPDGTMRFDLAFAKTLWWIDGEALRRSALHELGHALGLKFEPFTMPGGEIDDWHYRGPESSVMHPEETEDADHLTKVDLDAYFAKVEKDLR